MSSCSLFQRGRNQIPPDPPAMPPTLQTTVSRPCTAWGAACALWPPYPKPQRLPTGTGSYTALGKQRVKVSHTWRDIMTKWPPSQPRGWLPKTAAGKEVEVETDTGSPGHDRASQRERTPTPPGPRTPAPLRAHSLEPQPGSPHAVFPGPGTPGGPYLCGPRCRLLETPPITSLPFWNPGPHCAPSLPVSAGHTRTCQSLPCPSLCPQTAG